VDSPDIDFNFGSREDQDEDRDMLATNFQALKLSPLLHLLDNDNDHDILMGGAGSHEEDEEDILGMLSKPVEVVIAKKNLDSRTLTILSHPTPLPGQGSRPTS